MDLKTSNNKRELLTAIRMGKLEIMNPISFIIDEICDCLLMDKYVAATTATNLLLEETLKLALIIDDSKGKTLDNGVVFEHMYQEEVDQNIDKKLSVNIDKASKKGLIDDKEKEELHYMRQQFRNPFSHGSHNEAIKGAKMLIATANINDVSNIKYKKVPVTNQPLLYYLAKHEFLKREAIGYFLKVYHYIVSFDKKLQQLYKI